jgi:molybdenum cofactor cytidylyltransferase
MTAERTERIGGLLLAAGGSSRLGSPKQLLKFEGKSLIRRAAETLVDSACDPVVVVLGAELDQSEAEIGDLFLTIYVNEEWQTGMSSSIRSGLAELLRIEPDLAAVVITLCDQPHITSDNIDQIIAEFHASRGPIISAEYGGTSGVPALFTSEIFPELYQLEGDTGARQVIRKQPNRVRTIRIENAAIDVDTASDVSRLENSAKLKAKP